MAILIGSNDPIRRLSVEPLLAVRPDWPLVEIAGADHDNCVQKAQFRNELIRWLEGSR